MQYKNFKVRLSIFLSLLIGGVLTVSFAFAQYDYYDPYSNSNIDYFPTNPINVSPSRTGGSSGSAPAIAPTGKTPGAAVPSEAQSKTISCTNKPTPSPQNTRSVEIRDNNGKVFYLSPPKEELLGFSVNPDSDPKIYENKKEIGLITVDNGCYPKYGYVQNPPPVVPPEAKESVDSTGVPINKTAVNLDPATGKVYDAKTGKLIEDARYDTKKRAIYYKEGNSTFGKVLIDTYGYVNIIIHVAPPTTTFPSAEEDVDLLPCKPEGLIPVRFGEFNEGVSTLQKCLSVVGFQTPVNGNYDATLQKSVRSFYKKTLNKKVNGKKFDKKGVAALKKIVMNE